jgi:hypothetical protein
MARSGGNFIKVLGIRVRVRGRDVVDIPVACKRGEDPRTRRRFNTTQEIMERGDAPIVAEALRIRTHRRRPAIVATRDLLTAFSIILQSMMNKQG